MHLRLQLSHARLQPLAVAQHVPLLVQQPLRAGRGGCSKWSHFDAEPAVQRHCTQQRPSMESHATPSLQTATINLPACAPALHAQLPAQPAAPPAPSPGAAAGHASPAPPPRCVGCCGSGDGAAGREPQAVEDKQHAADMAGAHRSCSQPPSAQLRAQRCRRTLAPPAAA